MTQPNDLSKMLEAWPFDPTTVTARYVDSGEEGSEREVQLRLDLGILQLKLNGRPDGSKPHGHGSALEYYRRKMVTDRRAGPQLDADACSELQQECVQYYYRYLALMVLKDYEGVIRDTRHSLRIFELVDRYAVSEDLVWEFIQFKPYVLMMNTRARAEQLVGEGRVDEAVEHVERGMRKIRRFMEEVDEEEEPPMEECVELGMLSELIGDLRGRRASDNPVVNLKHKLQYAVHMENFEEAARLRDKIRDMERNEAKRARCSLSSH